MEFSALWSKHVFYCLQTPELSPFQKCLGSRILPWAIRIPQAWLTALASPTQKALQYSNSVITSYIRRQRLLQLLLFGLQHFLFDQYLPIHLLTAMSKCWHKLLVVHTMSKLNRYLLTGIVSNQPWTGDGLCDSLLEIIRQEGEWIPGV